MLVSGWVQMLDQVDGNSSVPLTGEDHRMAKKFRNAARQAFLTMQTPTPKRNGKKNQKFMQGEGSLHKSKSKKGLSGTTVISFCSSVCHCQISIWVVTCICSHSAKLRSSIELLVFNLRRQMLNFCSL